MIRLLRKKEKEQEPMPLELAEETAPAEQETTETVASDGEAPEEEPETEEQTESNPVEPETGDEELMAAFGAWLEEMMPDETRRENAQAAMEKIREVLTSGEFDDTLFDIIAKGSDYERAIAEAGDAGELRGRNMAIEELLKRPEDDGLPHMGCNAGNGPASRAPSIFDLAREA